MKKILFICFAVIGLVFTANAQDRIKIKENLYLVSYGNSVVIEDEENQRTISMSIAQEIIDQNNGEAVYNIVCGKWTKRVVKYGLKAAVAEGIKAAALTQGASLAVSATAELANWIYDDVCEYYGEKYK
jgi:hypothetical protein